jgi:hypothetical protein
LDRSFRLDEKFLLIAPLGGKLASREDGARRRMNFATEIERLLTLPVEEARNEGLQIVGQLREGLSRGEFRAAEKTPDGWKANAWVKRGILLAFKVGVIEDRSIRTDFYFFDKDIAAGETALSIERSSRRAGRLHDPGRRVCSAQCD